MKYYLKTQFGISSAYIQSQPDSFLFGTGQGSGASPAVWLSISTVLLTSLSKLSHRGMVFQDPSSRISTERFSDAYVDNNQNGLNDAGLLEQWSLPQLATNLQNMSQAWEQPLFCSGGALELSKCFYYLVYWKWSAGLPHSTPKIEIERKVQSISLTAGLS